jgi:polyribonucleotide 5'-hydroxyl-kinase
VHEYFYGKQLPSPPGSSSGLAGSGPEQAPRFRPHRLELSLSGCTFLSAGGVRLSDSMRPLGTGQEEEKAAGAGAGGAGRLLPVPPSADLEHAMLAVLHPPPLLAEHSKEHSKEDSEGGGYMNSNIAGFVYVVKLEPELNTVTVLSPCPGKLPSTTFLLGSIKWVE